MLAADSNESLPMRVDCSAKRPKKNPPCGVAAVEIVEGQSNEGVIGLGASAGNGAGKSEVKSASSKVPRNMEGMK